MSDCRFGVSPVNYPDPDPNPDPNWFDTNCAVQLQKMPRGLNFGFRN